VHPADAGLGRGGAGETAKPSICQKVESATQHDVSEVAIQLPEKIIWQFTGMGSRLDVVIEQSVIEHPVREAPVGEVALPGSQRTVLAGPVQQRENVVAAELLVAIVEEVQLAGEDDLGHLASIVGGSEHQAELLVDLFRYSRPGISGVCPVPCDSLDP